MVAGTTTAQHKLKRVYGNLESLRGIAALLVCLHHVPWLNAAYHLSAVRHGWVFVDFFFVLSGFVISYNYADVIRDRTTAWVFLIRRFFRLYPLHIAALAACLALDLVRNLLLPRLMSIQVRTPIDVGYWVDVGYSALLLSGVGVTSNPGPNSPSWSISTELFAYLAFCGIALVVGRARRMLAFMILAVLAFVGLQLLQGWSGINGPLEFRLLRCLYAFSLGVLVHELHLRQGSPSDSAGKSLILQLVAWACIGLLLASMESVDPLSSLLPPLFAAVVLAAVRDSGSVMLRLLGIRACRRLGDWSYSIYMVHAFVVSIIGFVVNRFSTGMGEIDGVSRALLPTGYGELLVLVYVALVLWVSSMTYRWIECPWRERGAQLARLVSKPLKAP